MGTMGTRPSPATLATSGHVSFPNSGGSLHIVCLLSPPHPYAPTARAKRCRNAMDWRMCVLRPAMVAYSSAACAPPACPAPPDAKGTRRTCSKREKGAHQGAEGHTCGGGPTSRWDPIMARATGESGVVLDGGQS